ncbi:acetate--CoA ligase family protein, partial [Candidatus Bathyarchaeota archaeon]|nr:acetate--CoA ligase family protein [Candidatus Bathyarchaeota archaeon]
IPSKGLIVQKMAPAGLEIVIGGINDDQFGPALMLGLGGIMIEIFKDVVFRIAPVSEEGCHSMIKQLKAYPLIKGYRGRGPYDEKILAQTLEKTSYLLTENPQIKELDLNPIILYQKDCLITDARIILESKS